MCYALHFETTDISLPSFNLVALEGLGDQALWIIGFFFFFFLSKCQNSSTFSFRYIFFLKREYFVNWLQNITWATKKKKIGLLYPHYIAYKHRQTVQSMKFFSRNL